MKVLLYTDVHFCTYSSIVRNRGSKYSVRLENLIRSVNWAENLADEENCDFIICLGDFFDKPELTAEELTALKDIKWSTIPHKFIVGNHEMASNDLTYNSMNALSKIGTVIDKPDFDVGFGYRLVYLPYVLNSNRKSISDYISEMYDKELNMWETQEYKSTIILSHNDISGLRYGKYMSTSGFDINDIDNNCDLFINGHLHNQQQVTDKILNLGNLTGQNFSEDAEKYSHCAAILDTDTLKINLINNPHALNFYKFDILSESDFYKFDKCKDNSVISIRTYQSLSDKLKVYLSNLNTIINYRLITIPEVIKIDKSESINQLITTDHIKQFKDYILENIENSTILNDELSLLV